MTMLIRVTNYTTDNEGFRHGKSIYAIVDDDFDYGAICDDCCNATVVIEHFHGEVVDWRIK